MYPLPIWNSNLTGSSVLYLATLPVIGRFGPFHSLFLKCLLKCLLLPLQVGGKVRRYDESVPSHGKNPFTLHLSSQVGTERPNLGHILFRTHQSRLPFAPALPSATAPHRHPCPRTPSRPAGWTRRRTTAWQWLTSPGIGRWAEPIRFLVSPENFD